MSKRHECAISEDGQHVIPCESLERETECGNPRPKKRGIFAWQYFKRNEGKPSRTFFGAVTTGSPTGFLFNFCPYCGKQIDAPFSDKDKPA